MTTEQYYKEHKQYGNRYITDKEVMDLVSSRSFSGIMNSQGLFVEENQLFNEEDWALFVDQFRSPVDIDDDGWRGEYFGKMMRGASMTYQYTRNEKLYAILENTAKSMLETQDENGRFSTYSKDHEFFGWDMWSRKYVILGFLHFHEICRDDALKARIITALERHLDYVVDHIGDGDGQTPIGQTSGWWGCINSASILEPVMKMYNITGKDSYLAFARYIIDFLVNGKVNIITLALEDKLYPYQYPVTKAYEMMSCFEGLLEYYRITGEEKHLRAVTNFARKVHESDITIIGCAGCMHELFNHAVATQTDTDYDGIMQETCVTVTWMKLCNQLLLLTGDAKYADYIERSMYNALYGSVNTEKRTENGGFMFDSYSPLTLNKRGRFIGGHKDIAEGKYYGCCAAIGAAGTALPLLTAVTATKSGVAVNYYESGTFVSEGIALSVETDYPRCGVVNITIDSSDGDETEILLRIPAFSRGKAKLSVNGDPCDIYDGYTSLSRRWSAGDAIKLELDMNPRILRAEGVEGKEKSKNYFAIMYGPLVLARDASFTEVGTSFSLADDTVTVTPIDCGTHKCTLMAKVTLGNGAELIMADYASCGKTWNEDTLTEAWIKCE